MSLLELLPSCVTPGVPDGEFLISSDVLLSPSRVNPGSRARSCHSRSSCPVVSLQDLLPSHVAHGALVGESISSSGVLHSPSRLAPGALAKSCHSW